MPMIRTGLDAFVPFLLLRIRKRLFRRHAKVGYHI